jgi:DNA-binding MarR family transcriptional regulator
MTRSAQHGVALGQVLEVAVLMGDDMTRGLARIGLTPPRAHLLWEVHHRGPTTQRELAEALNVSPRNVTGLVDALSDTGFVTREPHPEDRRATLVSLTRKGKRTAEGLVTGRDELAEQLFGDMSDRQLGSLVRGLDVVLERLRSLISAEAQVKS